MKMLWATDIHLDSANLQGRSRFINQITSAHADALLITGDIANGETIDTELMWILEQTGLPLYFVLGNHDYYNADIASVRNLIDILTTQHPRLTWLDKAPPVLLGKARYLVGDGGWGDARNGDFLRTSIRINDHRLIRDLTGHSRIDLQKKLHQLGEESAQRLAQKIATLLNDQTPLQEVVVATHVPPFPESAWYMGYSGAEDWIPDFTCKAVGDLLLQVATEHPQIQWTVLCGHGHHEGRVQMLDNLLVHTGKADYGSPAVERCIQFD